MKFTSNLIQGLKGAQIDELNQEFGSNLSSSYQAKPNYSKWNLLSTFGRAQGSSPISRRQVVKDNYENYNFFLTSPRSQNSIPSDDQIKNELKRNQFDLDPKYYGLVREFANQASGGRTNPSAYWRGLDEKEYERLVQQKNNAAEPFDKKNFKNYLDNIQTLLEKINFKKIPGFNGTQKACVLLKVLNEQAKKYNFKGITEMLKGSEKLPDLKNLIKPLNDLDSLSNIEQYLLSDEEVSKEEQGMIAGGCGKNLHLGLEHTRSVTHKLMSTEIMQRIAAVSGILKGFNQLKPTTIDPKSISQFQTEKKHYPIQNLSQLAKLDPRSWALYLEDPSLFWHSVTNHELMIREAKNDRTNDSKQLLYMLIDSSGSMDSVSRIGTALAVLLNRLEAVCEGKAELFYRFFDAHAYQEYHTLNFKDAKEALKRVKNKNFSGGSTSIDNALRTSVDRIVSLTSKEKLEKPEIAIVTDGEDEVSFSKSDLKGCILHCFFCGGSNSKLEQLAKQSGGVVIKL